MLSEVKNGVLNKLLSGFESILQRPLILVINRRKTPLSRVPLIKPENNDDPVINEMFAWVTEVEGDVPNQNDCRLCPEG